MHRLKRTPVILSGAVGAVEGSVIPMQKTEENGSFDFGLTPYAQDDT